MDPGANTSERSVVQTVPLPRTVSPSNGANRAENFKETREWPGTFCSTIGSILSSPELCDVTFLVGPECEPVRGVRAIMAARSKVFLSMLFGDRWLEQQGEAIPMPENGPVAFRSMMQYVHSGSVLFEPSTVMEVLQLSDYFGLIELKAGCGEYIAKSINTDTAVVLLQTAATFGEEMLVEKCLQFIELHTDEVLASASFTNAALSPDLLCKVLQSDKLSCSSELSLYAATVAWGRVYCEQNTNMVLGEILSEPIGHIRLPLIPTSGLMSVVRPDNLVPVDLLLEALAYHSDPGTVDGSRACFRKRSGGQSIEVNVPQWAPGYMSFLSSSGGHYYEFSSNRRTATKARNDGTIQSIRASEPLEPGKTHTFAFRVDKWQGGDIDVGFGVDCGSKLAWLRQNECSGGDWVVSQPAISEGDVIVVVVDLNFGTASFRKQNGVMLKQVNGVEGGIIYPAAAFRRVVRDQASGLMCLLSRVVAPCVGLCVGAAYAWHASPSDSSVHACREHVSLSLNRHCQSHRAPRMMRNAAGRMSAPGGTRCSFSFGK